MEKEKEILHVADQEVDDDGNLSIISLLPWTLSIKTQEDDNDPVEICYSDQCFSCPNKDGGHGWEVCFLHVLTGFLFSTLDEEITAAM